MACTSYSETGDISSTLTLRKPSRASRHSAGCASRLLLDVLRNSGAQATTCGHTLFNLRCEFAPATLGAILFVLASEVPRTKAEPTMQMWMSQSPSISESQFMHVVPSPAGLRLFAGYALAGFSCFLLSILRVRGGGGGACYLASSEDGSQLSFSNVLLVRATAHQLALCC